LPEFEPDIAAAYDDQMPRQKIDLHHRRMGQIGDLLNARHRRHQRSPADIDENALGPKPLGPDLDLARRDKPGMTAVEGAVVSVFQCCGQTVSRLLDDGVLARFDSLHVDADVAGDRDAEFGRATGDPRGRGARHQCLGRGAAGIDAGAADRYSLGAGDLHAGAGKAQC